MLKRRSEKHQDRLSGSKLTCFSCNAALPAYSAYCPYCGHADPCAVVEVPYQEDESQVAEEIKELRLNQLEAFDYILIQTRNSLYKFTVMESARGGGLLSGGALGNKQLQAALLGAVCCKNSKSVSHCLTLKIGLSALFFLDEINDEKVNLETKKQLAISPITRLTHVCGGAITKSRSAFAGDER
jgi:hypothetical protein